MSFFRSVGVEPSHQNIQSKRVRGDSDENTDVPKSKKAKIEEVESASSKEEKKGAIQKEEKKDEPPLVLPTFWPLISTAILINKHALPMLFSVNYTISTFPGALLLGKSDRPNALLEKINEILRLSGKTTRLYLQGCCHGINLVWLKKMAQGKSRWYYEQIDKLALKSASELIDDLDIDKFIGLIIWCQRSAHFTDEKFKEKFGSGPLEYYHDGNIQKKKGSQPDHKKLEAKDKLKKGPLEIDRKSEESTLITDRDIDKILDAEKVFSKNVRFRKEELIQFFESKIEENAMVSIASRETRHSIGVIKQGHFYYLNQANFPLGRPKIFVNVCDMIPHIETSLYGDFGYPIHTWYDLEIEMARLSRVELAEVLNEFKLSLVPYFFAPLLTPPTMVGLAEPAKTCRM